MAEVVGLLRGDARSELHLHLQRVLAAVGDAQKARDADTVGVADVPFLAVHVPQNQVGSLPPHAGEPQQVLHVVGDLPAELRQQHPAGGDNVPRLGPPEAGGVDDLPHLLLAGLRQGLEGGEAAVEHRGHQVHPGVGALGGQAHGEQQLIGLLRVEGQGALRLRVQALQFLNDGVNILLVFHSLTSQSILPQISTKSEGEMKETGTGEKPPQGAGEGFGVFHGILP